MQRVGRLTIYWRSSAKSALSAERKALALLTTLGAVTAGRGVMQRRQLRHALVTTIWVGKARATH